MASGPITTLTFGFRQDPSFDELDDISVRQTGVPAPASLMLLGLGIAGVAPLVGMRRRAV